MGSCDAPPDPAQARLVADTSDERVAKEQDPNVAHTRTNHLDMLAPDEITARAAAPERGSQRTGFQARVAAQPMGALELRARRAEPRARPHGRVASRTATGA